MHYIIFFKYNYNVLIITRYIGFDKYISFKRFSSLFSNYFPI